MKNRTPWIYVPTLYLAEGLPYIIVISVSIIMFKKLGLSNQEIGLTRFLYLPWVIKMLWGPLVDSYKTKRSWILGAELLLALAFLAIAAGIQTQYLVSLSLALLFGAAFFSATHDIAIDGYYMLALNEKDQALFVGVRSTFYRIAIITGSGLLVVLAGKIETLTGNIPLSWSIYFGLVAALFFLFFGFHKFYLPKPGADSPRKSELAGSYVEIFKTYFKQPKIVAVVMFILLYRLGEAILSAMTAPFMLDSREQGGLGLTTETVGFLYGTVGVLSLVIGGILGGWLISRFGLRKCIWPMALMLKAPDIVYVYMSTSPPPLAVIYGLVALEQFGYGLGFTAFMVVLMYITTEEYKTSHFAISTGIMALGMMVPGLISGYLQQALGYFYFFIAVMLLTIPGLLTLFFIPLEKEPQSP